MKHSLVLLFIAAMFSVGAFAQSDKVGRIVIGDPPGSGIDPFARVLAEKLKDAGGRIFIVENRPGASSTIAAEAVARGAPDGSMLLIAPIGPLVLEPLFAAKLTYDAFADFTPLSQLTASYVAVALGNKVPAASLAEYLALAKKDTKAGFYSTAGTNGLPYILSVLLVRAADVKLTNVPYKSGQQAATAVATGEVQMGVLPMAESMPYHRRAQLRIVATSGDRRAGLLPDAPTLRELGFKDLRAETWFGFLAPAKMNATLADVLSKAASDIVQEAASKEMLAALGLEAVGSSAKEFAATMRRDRDYWGPIIKASGIRRE
ncbi:MAG: Bug family tripartite tricarboxylate transporter substrate binding protein [Burkholderiales bacterium]